MLFCKSGPSTVDGNRSYHVVVVVLWTSQVEYDVRYATNDVYHYIFKSLQVICFVLMAAFATSHWSWIEVFTTSTTQKADPLSEEGRTRHAFAQQASLFYFYHLLLGVQYLVGECGDLV